ncbi:hypothetical protein GCM10011342_21770 [Aquisalinus flavus]|uniref:DUF5597 domain-containing protein n=2 Tax=Aquisalinus flavus TaxID=1526572 RepID=A0A8J2V386_9PROT|nr:DUF5597 domain-containing protein [Aquisalinus flavus]MBD0425865.1 DUF5597 domain-containing protein [Aquisalinus flavus]UNE48538.1 hypothetical protein FF099_10995 [Aquisalinus flavus]GGD12638.1 hypothetical protein GCM10011342_21770 [Aquisalinus flavus]
MEARFVDPWTPKQSQQIASHGGLIIQTGPEEFIVAGKGMTLTFPDRADGTLTGIESVQEGRLVGEEWQGGRWLNGDQTHQGRHIRLPPDDFSIQRIRLYSYR